MDAAVMFCAPPQEIQVLGMYRDIVEEARDLISVHSMNMEAVFLYGNMAFDRVLGVSPQVRRTSHHHDSAHALG